MHPFEPYRFIDKDTYNKDAKQCVNIFNPLSNLKCENKAKYLDKCLINPHLDKYFPNDTDKVTRLSFCKLQQLLLDECCNHKSK